MINSEQELKLSTWYRITRRNEDWGSRDFGRWEFIGWDSSGLIFTDRQSVGLRLPRINEDEFGTKWIITPLQ